MTTPNWRLTARSVLLALALAFADTGAGALAEGATDSAEADATGEAAVADGTETAATDEAAAVEAAIAEAIADAPQLRGAATNLPLPRFVSLKAAEGNVRRGPSLSHRIDWVFRHADMPLRVTAEFGHWRRVEDDEGLGGWIHYSLLSGVRTVIVQADMTELHAQPDPASRVVAQAETGVIGRLGACGEDWCKITAGGEKGWVPKAAIWGVDPDEIRE